MQGASTGLCRRWSARRVCYACADGVVAACRRGTVDLPLAWVTRGRRTRVPANASVVHLPYFGQELRLVAVSGTLLDRCLGEVLRVSPGLRECTLPRTCARVAEEAFAGEVSLERAVLGKSLQVVGPRAFAGAGLRVLRLGRGVRAVEEVAFRDCTRLASLGFSKSSRLERLGPEAFMGTGLRSLVLPASLRVLSQGAFARCGSLRAVRVGEGLERLGCEEYDVVGDRYAGAFEASGVARVELSASLRAFAYSALEEVSIPASVAEIGRFAFAGCAGLASVGFAEGSRLSRIGPGAFERAGLREFAAPNALRSISAGAFRGCAALRWAFLNRALVVLGGGERDFEGTVPGVFESSALESVVLPPGLKALPARTFFGCEGLREIDLGQGLEEIGAECFAGSGLERVALPRGLRRIGACAFAGTGVREGELPPGTEVA